VSEAARHGHGGPGTADLRRFRTERLICEALRREHAGELAPLLNDPRVAATLSVDGRPPAVGGTPEQLASCEEHWRTYGFGLWLLRDRSTQMMVGRGGLQHTHATGTDEVEIAWAIVPERWRQGLATELAVACVEVAVERLHLDSVIAYTRPDNIASRRVMEKAGMRFEREFTDPSAHPAVLYRRGR
jgi:RimJ/RimL family protein N-acetyltransferase